MSNFYEVGLGDQDVPPGVRPVFFGSPAIPCCAGTDCPSYKWGLCTAAPCPMVRTAGLDECLPTIQAMTRKLLLRSVGTERPMPTIHPSPVGVGGYL